MYAAALSLPGVPVPRPSSASLARYVMSLLICAVSSSAVRGVGRDAGGVAGGEREEQGRAGERGARTGGDGHGGFWLAW